MSSAPEHRRRFHFSLRLLLILITILALGLGWIGMQVRWMRQRHEALRWLLPLRARQVAASHGQSPPPVKGLYVQHDGIEAPWSLAIFGEHGVEEIVVDSRSINSDSRYNADDFRRLFPEAEVRLDTSRENLMPVAPQKAPRG